MGRVRHAGEARQPPEAGGLEPLQLVPGTARAHRRRRVQHGAAVETARFSPDSKRVATTVQGNSAHGYNESVGTITASAA